MCPWKMQKQWAWSALASGHIAKSCTAHSSRATSNQNSFNDFISLVDVLPFQVTICPVEEATPQSESLCPVQTTLQSEKGVLGRKATQNSTNQVWQKYGGFPTQTLKERKDREHDTWHHNSIQHNAQSIMMLSICIHSTQKKRTWRSRAVSDSEIFFCRKERMFDLVCTFLKH